MHTGHRQTGELRKKYLHALLQQDVSYYDTESNTGNVVNSVPTDPLAVQDAVSEKVLWNAS
jgi:ATP-binding cassette subfamily B (MDR/TAP) protein 1